MLFLGWILLVWAAGEAESMAQGKEIGRWTLMHTDATWRVQGPWVTWGWNHTPLGQTCRHPTRPNLEETNYD